MNTIFVGTYEGRLLGYKLSQKKGNWKLELEYAVETHIGSVKSLDSEYVNKVPMLVSGGTDESIRLFDLTTAKEQGTILFHQGDISALQFTGPEFLISGGADGKLVVWRTSDWVKLHVLGSHKAAVTSVCVHPSNKIAISTGADNTMRLWNLVKGRLGFVRKLKESAVKIRFSPDGSEHESYAIMYSKSVVVSKVDDGVEIFKIDSVEGFNDFTILNDGKLILVGNDKKIHVFDKDGKEEKTIESQTELRLRTVNTVFVANSVSETPLIVTGSSDGFIQVWDTYKEKDNLLCSVKTSERITCATSLRGKSD